MVAKANVKAVSTEENVAAPMNKSITTDIQTGETTLESRKETAPNGRSRGNVTEKKNIFTEFTQSQKAAIEARHKLRQSVTQRLAEANDLYKSGDNTHHEAAAIADKAAVSLYRARVANLMTVEDVNGLLRDVFGAKRKGGGLPVSSTDPEASKTPAGKGEDIRKRVVRAVDAFHCARGNTDEAGRFFEGLEATSADKEGRTLSEVLKAVEDDEMSIWTAYEAFAAIKRNHQEKTAIAFDPGKISAIVQSLSGEEASSIIRDNPSLKAAYAALIEVLQVIGEDDGEDDLQVAAE